MPNKKAEEYTDLKDTYLECRDLGHSWRVRTLTRQEIREGVRGKHKALWGYLRVARCSRCRTVRTDRIDALGNVSTRSYSYPDNYQIEEKGVSKGQFRLEIIQRQGL